MHTLPRVPDCDLEVLLGLHRPDAVVAQDEREIAELIAVVLPQHELIDTHRVSWNLPSIKSINEGEWFGTANQLSHDHYPWEVIDKVKKACRSNIQWKPDTSFFSTTVPATNDEAVNACREPCPRTAGDVVRCRRSALAIYGQTTMFRDCFYAMLNRLVTIQGVSGPRAPWDVMTWPTATHLGLFVHRVDGLHLGLYMLVRELGQFEMLMQFIHQEFNWEHRWRVRITFRFIN